MAILSQINNSMVSFAHTVSEEISQEYMIHCHNFYEVYYFIEGDVDYLVEGRRYHMKPHSLLLLSPNVFHGVKVNSPVPYERFTLHFYPDVLTLGRRHYLLSAFPSFEKHSGREIFYPNAESFRISSFFQSFLEGSNMDNELQKVHIPIATEALLSQITVMSLSNQEVVAKELGSDAVSRILAYLNQHLTETFSLDQLSEHFYISKHHLNKVFRKATGTTVGDYILYKRIIYAQQLLINGHNATVAASEAGFGDYSSFYRAYMKFVGHSPIKDRGLLVAPLSDT